MPLISVVVPVYNSEKYLSKCLDSIVCQTFTDFECIIIDDGSNDRSPNICDEYSNRFDMVRVYHQENKGQSAARNTGIKQAKGKWISFIDSDDYVHPQYLEILVNAIISNKVKISMCGALFEINNDHCLFTDNMKPSYSELVVNENFFERMIDENWFQFGFKNEVVWGKLIDSEILKKHPFEEGRIYEDIAIVCRWFESAKYVVNCDSKLYYYNDNPKGTVNSASVLKRLDNLWALEEMESFYKKHDYKRPLLRSQETFISRSKELEKALNNPKYKREFKKNRYFRRKKIINLCLRTNISSIKTFLMYREYW